ncbi:two-component regulator propeller domain-containing protein [Salmonirosea aquatica]|uniref:Uncharacterized protein n=1 Tax=Salmonirosea aquatica TaxID=2654236 RepID=A0A7C9BMG6_9BACT|nr:hypothetical protein [Cytophagaceae bacterium SJW1-29]
MAIFEDSRGTFWSDGWRWIDTFDRKTGKFTRHSFQEAHSDRLSCPFPKEKNLRSFPTNGIRFFLEDPAGGIWIGTLDGGEPVRSEIGAGDFVQNRRRRSA